MEAVASKATRIIFKCNLCKHVWAHDYQQKKIPYNTGFYIKLYRTWEPAPQDVNQHPFSTPEWDKRCPICHHLNVKSHEVIGTVTSKPCDERCMSATSHVCNCQCGGVNHGKAHLS